MGSAILLSGMGVAIAIAAFYNRDNPAWQSSVRPLMFLAVVQVLLGVMAWFVTSR